MALDRIEELLEKYFEAQTSIAEEKELKDYFSSNEVAIHLEQYKPMFGYVVMAKEEKHNKNIPLNNGKNRRIVWFSYAASVIVFLGTCLFVFNYNNQLKSQDLGTFEDPEVAFRETQKALNLISEHVNSGREGMSYLNEYQQSINKIFKK